MEDVGPTETVQRWAEAFTPARLPREQHDTAAPLRVPESGGSRGDQRLRAQGCRGLRTAFLAAGRPRPHAPMADASPAVLSGFEDEILSFLLSRETALLLAAVRWSAL